MSRLNEKRLADTRQKLYNQAKAIESRADDEKRELTPDECESIRNLLDAVDAHDELFNAPPATGGQIALMGQNGHDNAPRKPSGDIFDAGDGRHIRAFRKGEPLCQERPNVSAGELIQGILTNKNPDIFAKQTVSSDSGGGYLLTPQMGANVVDLARSASVAFRAGAQTLMMNTSEMTIARVTGDPTGYWRPETVKVTASSMAFDKVVLRPKTLAAIIPVSLELLEDLANAASVIQQTLANALGLALDQAILSGDGAGASPTGIRNHADVNTIASVGTPTNYDDYNNAIGDVYAANYQGDVSGLSWISSPRDVDLLSNLKTGISSDNTPLMMPERVKMLQHFQTTSVDTDEGSGSDESWSIIGDFSQCVVGMRTSGVNIRIASDGTVNDGSSDINATSQLMRHVVAYMRADVALLRPKWFTVLSGITVS